MEHGGNPPRNFCLSGFDDAKVSIIGSLMLDLLIDGYVTVGLKMIMDKADKDALRNPNVVTRRTRRTIFTSVKYWNYVRLALAVIYNVIILIYTVWGFYETTDGKIKITENALRALFAILLSLAIT